MSCDNGHNPMHWDCRTQGCFNVKKRPKIEVFADCLPGKMAFTDVDAVTEISGNFLYLEWKDHQELSVGQRVLFERLTALCPATVMIVEGDAEQMTVSSLCAVRAGIIGDRVAADLDDLRRCIQVWQAWALANSAMRRPQGASCN